MAQPYQPHTGLKPLEGIRLFRSERVLFEKAAALNLKIGNLSNPQRSHGGSTKIEVFLAEHVNINHAKNLWPYTGTCYINYR